MLFILHDEQLALVNHGPQSLYSDLSHSPIFDESPQVLRHNGAKGHFLTIWEHTVEDLTVLLIALLILYALHLRHLVRVLSQFTQLTITKAKLGVEELQPELEHLIPLNVVEHLLREAHEILLKPSFQN